MYYVSLLFFYLSGKCNRVHSLINDNEFKVIRAKTIKKYIV